jgi:plastocyanin
MDDVGRQALLAYSSTKASRGERRLKKTALERWRALALASIFASQASIGGGIAGTVVLVGPAPAARKVEVTADQYVCGTEKDSGDLIVSQRKEIANAVVWLDNPPSFGASPAQSKKVEIDQKACVYVPRVVVVPVGGTVDFLNSDRLLHNIHSTPKLNASFNRTQPKNRTIPVTFDKSEIVEVICDLHPWMQAWVVVAAHPFYAVTGKDGGFAFNDLPAGQYRLQVWHERLGKASAQVNVVDQQTTRTTFEMQAP